jgi:methyl coenzyme M reductase beta subunit
MPCHYEEKQQMNNSFGEISRRDAIQRAIGAAVALALACVNAGVARAAQQKLAKAAVNYADVNTYEGMDCDDCAHFVPGKTAKATGTCRIVAGAISPHGHCMAFSPGPAK